MTELLNKLERGLREHGESESAIFQIKKMAARVLATCSDEKGQRLINEMLEDLERS